MNQRRVARFRFHGLFWYILWVRKHLVIVALYTALALLLTWPLALHFDTHVVGDGSDDPALTWNLWWFKHAVLDLHTSPLTTDFMFYPIGINLVFYTLTLLNDALSLPLQAVFGLVPAANLLLLSSFVLSGYGVFLLVRCLLSEIEIGSYANAPQCNGWRLEVGRWELGVAILPAFIAGLVYAFSSNKMLYASLGQFNIASSQWIPFYVLYLFKLRATLHPSAPLRSGTRHSTRDALMAALFLLLQAYAELTFASFLAVFTLLFVLLHLRPLKASMPLARSLALMLIAFVLGFLPILVPLIQEMRVEGDILVQGSGFAEAFSADVLGFFVPSKLNPLLGWLDGWFQFSYINFVFIGWLTLVLALTGVWTYRQHFIAKFWSITTCAFVLISLGPALRINGQEIAIPLPFTLFQLLPFFKGNRYPSRYSVMITLGIAILVGLGVKYLFEKGKLAEVRVDTVIIQGRRLISPHLANFLLFPLFAILLLAEHLSALPLSDLRVPAFYQTIRDEPGDFTVLELPLAWRNGFRVTGTLDKVFMLSQFYQTVHEKRMLSGNTSRNPELKFQYFTEAPLINSLIALETGHEIDAATLAQDKQLAPDVMRFFNVRYIVLRPEAGAKLRPYLESVLPDLELWRAENSVRVYRLPPPAEPRPEPVEGRGRVLRVDPKSPMARLYFAEGWGELGEQRVWAQRHETRLLLPLQNADAIMTLRLTVPDERQKVMVLVNGRLVGSLELDKGTRDYPVLIPIRLAYQPVNDVILHWSKMWGDRWWRRLDPNVVYPGSIVVKSAGEAVGDFAHIWIAGVDVSPNQRGYNVATIPDTNSQDIETYHFDTFESVAEADRMERQVLMSFTKLEASADFAMAVRDEASRKLTSALFGVLKTKGVNVKVGWRWSHAFVRYADGQNIIIREDASPIRPAIVSIGERITAPQVAGAVEWIEVRPAEGAP